MKESRSSMQITVKEFGTVNNLKFDEIFVEKEGNFDLVFPI